MLLEDTNPARAYLFTLRDGSSRRTMKRGLDVIAEIVSDGENDSDSLDWSLLKAHHIAQIRTRLRERYQASTTNKYLVAVRNVMKHAMHMGLIDWQVYQHITTVRSLPLSNELVGRFIERDEFNKLLETCGDRETAVDKRDYALFWLLYTTGLRRGELANLKVHDYDSEDASIDITKSKHNQLRTVYLPSPTVDAIDDWLLVAQIPDEYPVIQGIRKNGVISTRRSGITDQAIYLIMQKRCEQAGIKEHLTLHDFRRTFISLMLDNNVDILTVSKIAGHYSIKDTARYDRRKEAPKRRAVLIFEE